MVKALNKIRTIDTITAIKARSLVLILKIRETRNISQKMLVQLTFKSRWIRFKFQTDQIKEVTITKAIITTNHSMYLQKKDS